MPLLSQRPLQPTICAGEPIFGASTVAVPVMSEFGLYIPEQGNTGQLRRDTLPNLLLEPVDGISLRFQH